MAVVHTVCPYLESNDCHRKLLAIQKNTRGLADFDNCPSIVTYSTDMVCSILLIVYLVVRSLLILSDVFSSYQCKGLRDEWQLISFPIVLWSSKAYSLYATDGAGFMYSRGYLTKNRRLLAMVISMAIAKAIAMATAMKMAMAMMQLIVVMPMELCIVIQGILLRFFESLVM